MKKRVRGLMALILSATLLIVGIMPAEAEITDDQYTGIEEADRYFKVYIPDPAGETIAKQLEKEGTVGPFPDGVDTISIGAKPAENESIKNKIPTFYQLSGWNVWSVNDSGAVNSSSTNVAADLGVDYVAAETEFKAGGYYSSRTYFFQPILEAVLTPTPYTVQLIGTNGEQKGEKFDWTVESHTLPEPDAGVVGYYMEYSYTESTSNNSLKFFVESADEAWSAFALYGDKLTSGSEIKLTETKTVPYYVYARGSKDAAADTSSTLGTMGAVIGVFELDPNQTLNEQLGAYKNHYTLSESAAWKVWEVDSGGNFMVSGKSYVSTDKAALADWKGLMPKEDGSSLVKIQNTRSGDDRWIPVLEAQYSPIDYTIKVYDSQGKDTGKTITLNIENYASTIETLPTDINVKSWKLVYGTKEYTDIASVEDIWTKGIAPEETINGELKLCAVTEQGEATFSMPNWHVGQTGIAPTVSSTTNGTEGVQYYYKSQGAADTEYQTVMPTAAGNYTAKAVFPARNGYDKIIKTCDFTISYLPSTASMYEISGTAGANGWYTSAVTVSAASGYNIRKSAADPWADSVTFEQSQANPVVYIKKTDTGALTDAISLGGIKIDTTAPVFTGSGEGITLDTQSWNTLAAPGSITFGSLFYQKDQQLTVKGSDGESGIASYGWLVSDTGLSQAQLEAKSDSDWKVLPEGGSFQLSESQGEKQIVYVKVTNQAGLVSYISTEGLVYDITAPAIAGVAEGINVLSATATVTVTVTDNYLAQVTLDGKEVTITDGKAEISLPASDQPYTIAARDQAGNEAGFAFTVEKAQGTAEFTQAGWYLGEEKPAPVVSSGTNGTDHVTYFYKAQGAQDSDYSETVPTTVGSYTAKAVFAETDTYKEVVRTSDFSISYLPVSQENYTVSGKTGEDGWYTGTVTIAAAEGYQLALGNAGEPDSLQWKSQIEISETTEDVGIYLKKTDSGALTDRIELGNISIDMEVPVIGGIVDGETYEVDSVEVEITDANLASVTVNGSQWTVSQGKAAGTLTASGEEYNIIATDAAGNQASAAVRINGKPRLEGAASFTQAGWYVGEAKPQAEVSSATNGTDQITYYYKKTGAADSEYSQTVPTEPGKYTAKAVFAMTEDYYQVEAACDFTISYLPAPENPYTLSGTAGQDGWYTSPVAIRPANGYQIRLSNEDSWADSVSVAQSNPAVIVYLKSATGAQTQAIEVGALKVDTEMPVINGAADGETYYGDSIDIGVTDDNLSEVTVNGQPVGLSGGSVALALKTALEDYRVTATDLAGNTKEIIFRIQETWVRDGIGSEGKKMLSSGIRYRLGSGTWRVSGDSTVYAGGVDFYVNENGEFDFSME